MSIQLSGYLLFSQVREFSLPVFALVRKIGLLLRILPRFAWHVFRSALLAEL
jgi:hypothetical protein